tara:strand:+ start:4988 stop:5194 length:207 start_codon:yes stop_codon:yes gene_type:complete
MQVINDRPTCMACKKTFMEATKEKWRLLPMHKVKNVLEVDVDTKKKFYFGLFCGTCIQKLESVKIKNA